VTPSNHVLLADCFTRSGLAIARSLGRHGLKVVAVSRSTDNLVARSRYLESLHVGPDPVTAREEYAKFIARISEMIGATLVIPITDAALVALDEHRDHLPATVPLALPGRDAIAGILDKRRNLAMAHDLGVPCPREYAFSSRAQTADMIATLGFPLVVKDPTPNTLELENPLPFRVAIARDEPELEKLLDIVDRSDAEPLFQEYVRGDVVNICSLAIGGEIVAIHAYVSRRRSAHEGIARETIELNPRLAEYAKLMLQELRWTGVAHMQFLVDPATGDCGYMETNGRFWASTQGSINAGWDFPWWFYQAHVSGERPIVPPIKVGSRTVYRKADIQHLLRHLAHGPALATGYSGRLSAIWQTLRDFRPGVHSDVWMWSDLKPAIWDILQLFSWMNIRKLFRVNRSD